VFAPGTKKLTPVMRQYRDAKNAYPDAILFFRLGDFYEMFNDDAVVAARELPRTLTTRNKGAPTPVPMAGVPYHAAHNYLVKLLARGHKVAICEQMGDPSKIKGIVPRKVVRVLTPGLLTSSDQLDARQNNYLCALDCNAGGVSEGDSGDERLGMALLDLSTGELSACSVESGALLIAEVARAEPRETLLPAALDHLRAAIEDAVPGGALCDDDALEDADVAGHLDQGVERPLYKDASAEHDAPALRAAARALRFARHYLPDTTLPVRRVARYDPHACLRIDETAQKHLELVRGTDGTRKASLLAVIDATVTSPGARLLRRRLLAPLVEVAPIRRRHDAVELFVQNPRAREELRTTLQRIGDMERLAVRASLHESPPRDLAALRASLAAVPDALAAIRSIPATDETEALQLDVDVLPSLRELLTKALVDEPPARVRDTGIFRAGYDAELDELRSLRENGNRLIRELEARLREETSIPSLKLKHTRAFGWYIEVTKAHIDKAPEHWRRRQTLTNAERYLDDELEELADKLAGAEERFASREAELFEQLVEKVAQHADGLRALAAAVADWDVAAGLAETAQRHNFSRPEVADDQLLMLKDARHPVVETFVPHGQFVPNDATLDLDGERLWLITGPNMAGKSTLMRQVALNVLLAQMGSFIPAQTAHIGIVDRVLSRVGASDNLARGESTFMVEMRETATILRDATRRSLVILDEIGRGTSTYDGLAIAWAVAEHLHENVRCRAMFATHYHQLTELADDRDGIANYSVSAREHDGELVFLHRLTQGAVSKSYGIAVARLAGVPETVLGRASAILDALENETAIAGGPGAPTGATEAQLDLFRRPAEPTAEDAVAQRLRHTETNRLTPLEALQLLDELKRELK
jgi:DNA mismatch repair protein MutS